VPIILADGLLNHVRASSAAIALEVVGTSDPEAVARGLQRAVALIDDIRHPEEPSESYSSSTRATETSLFADMADAEAHPGILEAFLQAIVDGLAEAGVVEAVIQRAGETPTAVRPPQHALVPPPGIAPPDGAADVKWFDRWADTGGLEYELARPFDAVAADHLDNLRVHGWDVSLSEPRFLAWGSPNRIAEYRVIDFVGHGWKGRANVFGAANRSRVEMSFRRDFTFQQLRRDGGIATGARRREYDEESSSAARSLIEPDDLPGTWLPTYRRGDVSAFCDDERFVRDAPNDLTFGFSEPTLLAASDALAFVSQGASASPTADEARLRWAWVERNYRVCQSCRSTAWLGAEQIEGDVRWQRVDTAQRDDVFIAAQQVVLPDGRRVVGTRAFFTVDRFIASAFPHGLDGVALPDVEGLVTLAMTRLEAVARAYPSLGTSPRD
jgi:hypothetical protein